MTTTTINGTTGHLEVTFPQTLYPVAEQDRAVTLEIRGNRDPSITVNLEELSAALSIVGPVQREQLLRELQSKQEHLDRVTASLARAERAAGDYYRDLIESQKREKRLWKALKKRERTVKAFRLVVKELSR